MTDYSYPNRIRAYTALLIYSDAMRPYIADTLRSSYGDEWLEKCVLDPTRKRASDQRAIARIVKNMEEARMRGVEDHLLIEPGQFSYLLRDHMTSFEGLNKDDRANWTRVRALRNDFLEHSYDEGDCTDAVLKEIIRRCSSVLNRCGLDDAAEAVRALEGTPASMVAGEVAARDETKFDQRDLARLATRPAAGRAHNIALSNDGTVECWGDDGSGQCSDKPEGQFIAVSAGSVHSIALRDDGIIKFWGYGGYGLSREPAGQFTAISAGRTHNIALSNDGTIECWGNDDYGQCSDKPTEGRFIAVSAGSGKLAPPHKNRAHSIALSNDGTIECWGNDDSRQCSDKPTKGHFIAISAGHEYSIALRNDGAIECWGNDDSRQCSDKPTKGHFIAISAGHEYSIALRNDGAIECWGNDDSRQCSGKPTEGRFIAVSAGGEHSIALREDGKIVCWGSNEYGQRDVPEGNFLL